MLNLDPTDIADFKRKAIHMLGFFETLICKPLGPQEEEELTQILSRLKGASQALELPELENHFAILLRMSVLDIEPLLDGIRLAKQLIHQVSSENEKKIENSYAQDFTSMVETTPDLIQATNEMGLIYLVDDEPEIVDILNETLTGAGFTTVKFTDSERMLDQLKKQTPNLVITDMRMPCLSGLEILKEVKKLNSDTPVIFISGHLDTSVLLEGIAAGVFGAIEKPFRMAHVIQLSENAVRINQLCNLVNRSFSLLLFRFTDLRQMLVSQGNLALAKVVEEEFAFLIEQRRKFRDAQRKVS